MKRLSSLDGFRGIAIVLVVMHHMVGFLQGWVGVDIFFVLSGYLITTILLNERNEQHFWKIFYTRRIARIVPAFCLLLLLGTVAGVLPWKILWPYLLLFGANVASLKYDDLMVPAGLNILWSLAVEEHFYFFWPFQVRRFSHETLTRILLALLVLEPITRTVAALMGASWLVTYFLTPFRLDGLAAGGLLALALSSELWRDRLQRVIPGSLIACLIVLLATSPWMIQSRYVLFCNSIGYSLIALTSVSAVAYLILWPQSMVARIFSWKPLVFIGLISYGLYLFHIFIYQLMLRFANDHGYQHIMRIRLMSLPVTVLFSWLSFKLYETPILKWSRRRVAGYREEEAVSAQVRL